MQVTVNDMIHEVPFSWEKVTLGKFVEYYEKYGRDLDKQLTDLLDKKYEGDEQEIELFKAMDIENHLDNEALAWYSFWTDADLFEARSQPAITPLLQQYRILRFLLKETQEKVYELPTVIEFANDKWAIMDFKINPASDMSFNEIITSKEAMRQIYKVGQGKWEALPYLCAVFFRIVDEPFEDEFVQEGSDRMELLKSLPLIHAMQVAFFLSICVSTWSKTLAYSKKEEETISLN
jgi:hypothetical protein